MCILLYVKLIWCSGFPEIYARLEEGEATSYLSVHFIWELDLIQILATRCHYQRGTSYLSVHFIWKYELTLKFTLASQRSFLQKTNKHSCLPCLDSEFNPTTKVLPWIGSSFSWFNFKVSLQQLYFSYCDLEHSHTWNKS